MAALKIAVRTKATGLKGSTAPRANEWMSNATAAEVVSFWRDAGPDKWFDRDEAFDRAVRSRFLPLHEAAARGELAAWEASAEGAPALLIVLDQFPRNMFRGSARAFATDALARAVADRARTRLRSSGGRRVAAVPYLPFISGRRRVRGVAN